VGVGHCPQAAAGGACAPVSDDVSVDLARAERLTRTAVLADGRRLGFAEWGDPDGWPLLFFHGTPSSRLGLEWAEIPAAERGVRVLSIDRPGHGLSDPAPGRTLLDWTRDVTGFAGALGLERFGIAGWSGGGPYVLACAYALADRLTGAAVLSGCGPLDTRVARRSSSPFDRMMLSLSPRAPRSARLLLKPAVLAARRTPRLAVKSFEQDLSPRDLQVFRQKSDAVSAMEFFLEAFRSGSAGVVDDYRVLASPWGFTPEEIDYPVHFWHGDDDRIVAIAEARALTQRMPNATFTVVPGEGHLMLMEHGPEVFAALAP
jgi:pimeloyl-ACP methyl ester carboxylesterase